jgi:hypothetical protein
MTAPLRLVFDRLHLHLQSPSIGLRSVWIGYWIDYSIGYSIAFDRPFDRLFTHPPYPPAAAQRLPRLGAAGAACR